MTAPTRYVESLALGRPDTVTLVAAVVWLTFLLPAYLVVTPLGGIGQPALLVGFLGATLWIFAKSVASVELDRGPNPIRWLLLSYLSYLALNFTILQIRAQTALEASSSTRSMVVTVALVGLALLICDATPEQRRLDAIVHAITYAAMIAAAIAFVQFFFGIDLPSKLRIPGLSFRGLEFDGIAGRGDLNRPSGTMSHAIELGVVMGAVLPLAVHTARFLTKRPRLTWVGVAMIGAASMLSISRSGILSALIAIGILSLAWSWRERANAALAALALIGAMWAMIPGLISTFLWFFMNIDTEESAQARVDRFPAVVDVASQRPWFGRGTGTFTVEEGMLLDQQLYQTIIELGIIGTIVTLALLAMGIVVGFAVWRRMDPGSATGHLALALTGTVVALSVTGLTYTAFFYRVHISLLFLAIGCLGGLWRFAVRSDRTHPVGT